MKTLVVFATTEGHTRKIAEQVSEWLRLRGFESETVECSNRLRHHDLRSYDAVVLAGSLHVGKHQESLVNYVIRHSDDLEHVPTWFISASATASKTDLLSVKKANDCIEAFIEESGFRPTMCTPIGGALLYTRYNMVLRWALKKIAEKEGGPTDTSRDYELTDWIALETSLMEFLQEYVEGSRTGGKSDRNKIAALV